MALSRDEIVATAVTLLHEEGLDRLSLRRLASRLGISAPTLYWHVKDKRQLLDLMLERIFADYRERNASPVDIGTWPWIDRVGYFMRMRYRALIETRDAPLLFAGNRPTEAMLPLAERWLTGWIDAGFSHDEAYRTILAIGNFILGSALEYQAEADRAALRKNVGRVSPFDGKDAYPNLKKAVLSGRQSADPHAPFETGLTLWLDALRLRLAAIQNEKSGPDGAAP